WPWRWPPRWTPGGSGRRHQLLQGEPGDLAADRVERRDRHRSGGVVDDQVGASDRLEVPYVPALTADDAALHLVRRKGHDRHGGLGDHLAGDTLDGGVEDAAG